MGTPQLVTDLASVRGRQVVALRDGSAVRLRSVGGGDEPALREFLKDVSTDSLHLRFFGLVDRDCAAASLADCSRPGDFGLVAQLDDPPSIVGHAALYRTAPDRAEVAFLVADAWQGRGLGSMMFSRLAAQAREQGIATLVAEVLPTNRGMLSVFQRSGYPVQVRRGADAFQVRIETIPPAPAVAA